MKLHNLVEAAKKSKEKLEVEQQTDEEVDFMFNLFSRALKPYADKIEQSTIKSGGKFGIPKQRILRAKLIRPAKNGKANVGWVAVIYTFAPEKHGVKNESGWYVSMSDGQSLTQVLKAKNSKRFASPKDALPVALEWIKELSEKFVPKNKEE